MNIPAGNQAQGGGSWTIETCFVPVYSRSLMQPQKRGAQQPRAQTHRSGCCSPGLPKMVWGEVPRDPEALSIRQSRGAARATSRPTSPSPFGTHGRPPPSPGSPVRAFCRWTAGSGCTGCRSTSLPAQQGEEQDSAQPPARGTPQPIHPHAGPTDFPSLHRIPKDAVLDPSHPDSWDEMHSTPAGDAPRGVPSPAMRTLQRCLQRCGMNPPPWALTGPQMVTQSSRLSRKLLGSKGCQ